jgi:hypothetical protein
MQIRRAATDYQDGSGVRDEFVAFVWAMRQAGTTSL